MARIIFITVSVVLLFGGAGCVHQHRGSGGLALSAYDGMSQDYPDDGRALADQAADTLAQKFPPGGTTLALVQTDTYFGTDFESALRGRGFAVSAPATPESPGILVAYTLDIVQETTPSVCYLQVRTSDGVGFGTTRRLGAKSTRQAPAPLDEPFHAQQSSPAAAPESYTLPDAAPQAPASSSGPTQPATGQAPALPPAAPAPELMPAVTPVLQQLPPVDTAKVTPPVLASSLEAAPATSPAVTPPAPVAQGTQSQSPYLHKEAPASLPEQTPSPAAQASAPSPSTPAPEPVPVPPETPPPADPAETWGIEPGSLLTQLEEWTSRARYKLIWKSKNDYEMSAASQFHCDFVNAVKQLFRGLHNNGHALRVTVYQGNHVLEVAED